MDLHCGILTQVIDAFLINAKESLSVRPQTVEEVGEVTASHQQLSKERPKVEPNFIEAEKKNKLLRSVAGAGMEELTNLKSRWDRFEVMMESHQLMVQDQVRNGYSQFEIFMRHKGDMIHYYCSSPEEEDFLVDTERCSNDT